MANEMNQQQKTKICPTCGTRMNESATRCLVCGRTFTNDPVSTGKNSSTLSANDNERIEKPRLHNVSISVPIFIGLVLLLIGIGAAVAAAAAIIIALILRMKKKQP